MLLLPTSCGPGPPLQPIAAHWSVAEAAAKTATRATRIRKNTAAATATSACSAASSLLLANEKFNTNCFDVTSSFCATSLPTATISSAEDLSATARAASSLSLSSCVSGAAALGADDFSITNHKNKLHKNANSKTGNMHASYNTSSISSQSSCRKNSSIASSSSSIQWLLLLLIFFGILAQAPHQVAAEKSKHYYMQSLCKNHFLQQLYRKIDGAVLWSQNERNLNCIITFQTHSILQRFMLRFDMLQLDCNDHLYVYDGAHAVAQPKIDISCKDTKQAVASILTRTNFVTLKYVTDNWGTDANGFKLVITSVKDPKHTCKDFVCGTREFCIHPDLLCDGINHCGDNSDESVHNLCQNDTSSTVFGIDMTWFVLIVVSGLLVTSAIIVGIVICVCRNQDEASLNQNTAMQMHHTAETNGSSKHLHHYQHGGMGMDGGGTLSRGHTQLPSSGNCHHPAGPSGYHRIPHNLLKMATKVRPIWCLVNFVN